MLDLNRLASFLFFHETKGNLRNWFYKYLPITGSMLHLISLIMPTFVPIEGYLMEYIPKKGDSVVDAGAFPGNFTIILSRLVGKRGVVVAVEPDMLNYNALVSRFNKLRLKNVILLNVALWNSNGEACLRVRGDEGSSLFDQEEGRDDLSTESIETRKLDSIINELSLTKIAYIKMDIEGAEIEALEGAQTLLLSQNTHLAIASYHIRNSAPTYVILSKNLTELGYRVKIGFQKHLTLYGHKI